VIRGKAIRLRTVRETDLDRLYTLLTDLANRGDFVPLRLPSEATFTRSSTRPGSGVRIPGASSLSTQRMRSSAVFGISSPSHTLMGWKSATPCLIRNSVAGAL
jgi:hypothetical protein